MKVSVDGKGKYRVKPCPFCGSKATVWHNTYADCSNDTCCLHNLEYPPSILKWNTRACDK